MGSRFVGLICLSRLIRLTILYKIRNRGIAGAGLCGAWIGR